MKKRKIGQLLLGVCLFALIVLIVKDGLSYNKSSAVESDGNVTVTVINTCPDAGDLIISYKENDQYIALEGNTVEVKDGTKVKIAFADSINEGYEVICWAIDQQGVLTLVESNDSDDSVYRESKFIKTVSDDLTVYFYGKEANQDVLTVRYYDSSVEGKRHLVGLSFVEKGESANQSGVIEQSRAGFSQTGWSEDLTNVVEDMEVYPTFDSSVWTVFRDYHSYFMRGLLITLLLSVVAVVGALFFAIVLCLMRLSSNPILKFVASFYVEVIRGVPLLLQLLLVYVLLGPTKIAFGSFFTTEVISCIITLTINSSAYSSEIFRSGIQSVDKGQMEAGRALGLSKWQVYFRIVIPQGIKNALPSLVNELVAMIKETSLAVSVDASIGELMCVRKNITAATYINLPPYIIVAIIYFVVTFSLSKVVGLLERRLNARD